MKCLVFTLWFLPVTISLNGPLMPLYKSKLLFAPISAMESHKLSSVKFLSHLPDTSSRLVRHQLYPVKMSGPSDWFTDHRRGMITTMIKEYISELGPPVTVPIGKFRKNIFAIVWRIPIMCLIVDIVHKYRLPSDIRDIQNLYLDFILRCIGNISDKITAETINENW